MREKIRIQIVIAISILLSGFSNLYAQNYPMSDPNNLGGWILNEKMSDEFNGTGLDRSKWWILGEEINGTREYRITSYNVCYTKLLRNEVGFEQPGY